MCGIGARRVRFGEGWRILAHHHQPNNPKLSKLFCILIVKDLFKHISIAFLFFGWVKSGEGQ